MTNQLESVPTEWTCADETFFSLVQRLFDAAFLYGAGVLLASYDPAEPVGAGSEPVVADISNTARNAASAHRC